MLGGLRAECGEITITRFRTQKTGWLLAYLAYYLKRVHPREELAGRFWPDAGIEEARTNLRTALSSLRRQLEPPGTPAGAVLIAEYAPEPPFSSGSLETARPEIAGAAAAMLEGFVADAKTLRAAD